MANPPIDHTHILIFNAKQGIPDEQWVPRAAEEDWIVVTGDSGATKLGAPIQVIMPQYGVTGIYFSGKLQQQSGFVKLQALISVLQHLPMVSESPKGSRFRLHMKSGGGFGLRPWPLVPPGKGPAKEPPS